MPQDASSTGHAPPLPRCLPLTQCCWWGGATQPDTQTPADYMSDQTDINDKMRAILIDWLVEVHLKFKLMPETLFLTTNLIDRFLAKEPVSRKNLQVRPRCHHAPSQPRPSSHSSCWVASLPARGRSSGTSRLRLWLGQGGGVVFTPSVAASSTSNFGGDSAQRGWGIILSLMGLWRGGCSWWA
jgi:hypothetical protein